MKLPLLREMSVPTQMQEERGTGSYGPMQPMPSHQTPYFGHNHSWVMELLQTLLKVKHMVPALDISPAWRCLNEYFDWGFNSDFNSA